MVLKESALLHYLIEYVFYLNMFVITMSVIPLINIICRKNQTDVQELNNQAGMLVLHYLLPI